MGFPRSASSVPFAVLVGGSSSADVCCFSGIFRFPGILASAPSFFQDGDVPVGLFLVIPSTLWRGLWGFWAIGWVYELDAFFEFIN